MTLTPEQLAEARALVEREVRLRGLEDLYCTCKDAYGPTAPYCTPTMEHNAAERERSQMASVLFASLLDDVDALREEVGRYKALALERYDDLEALHAELGEPYLSSTVKKLRTDAAVARAECERLRLALETMTEECAVVGSLVKSASQQLGDINRDESVVYAAYQKLESDLARAQAVVEAAVKWHAIKYCTCDEPACGECQLCVAVDAYLKEGKP